MKIFSQQPSDVLDYSINLTKWLVEGDNVVSSTAYSSPTGLNIVVTQENTNTPKVWISGGVDGVDGVAYVATFLSNDDKWQTLAFNEQDFVAQFRGRLVNRAPALSFSDVRQIGFMLADKQPGSFRLAIKTIGQ